MNFSRSSFFAAGVINTQTAAPKAICIFLSLMMTLCLAATALAAPPYSRPESAALLHYAKGCLMAGMGNSAMPAPPHFATKLQRPCFVTFFINKRVFACFGGFTPRKASLAEEIAENVRLALKNDARSRRISPDAAISAGVQITLPVGQPERVSAYNSIDPVREGMFVESPKGGVAFVPGEARTSAWAFREALRRLDERDGDHITVYRFRAEAISTRSGTTLLP